MSRANLRRARTAAAALAEYASVTASLGREGITDLVADLGHYCDSNDLDFLSLVEVAIAHWSTERSKPDQPMPDTMPGVTIIIDGVAP